MDLTWEIDDQLLTDRSILNEPLATDDEKDVQYLSSLDFSAFAEYPMKTIETDFVRKDYRTFAEWEERILKTLSRKYAAARGIMQRVPGVCDLNDVNATSLADGEVVSFRCMIQDEITPSYSHPAVAVKNPTSGEIGMRPTLFRECWDHFSEEDEWISRKTKLEPFSEKEVYFAITPPGEMCWVSREVNENEDNGVGGKKPRVNTYKEAEKSFDISNMNSSFPRYFFGMGDAKPMAGVLKIPKKCINGNLKVTDLVEVTGVVEYSKYDFVDSIYCEERDLRHVPVIHVFSCLKLADGNPRIPIINGKLCPLFPVPRDVIGAASTLRELFSLCLGGDRYAAVYAMISAVSRVIHRNETGFGPLGKIAVNIMGVDPSSGIPDEFRRTLTAIFPRVVQFALSVQDMNKLTLIPKKDLTTDVLLPGMLQLCKGTAVILDECALKEGQFDENGVVNMTLLKQLIEDQKVRYNFTYQFPDIEADCPIITFSKGPSILPHDIRITLNPDPKLTPQDRRIKISEILELRGPMLQDYLSMARALSFPAQVFADESVANDCRAFYTARNQPGMFKNKMKPQEFSCFITACRLWCLLHGSLKITREGLTFMKEVEQIRESRSEKQNSGNIVGSE